VDHTDKKRIKNEAKHTKDEARVELTAEQGLVLICPYPCDPWSCPVCLKLIKSFWAELEWSDQLCLMLF
jgi:hypothetical protein